ncbi:glycosyl transferase family 2 [Cyanobacterium stanieri PCC 7202]|uniref:4,4'-diaponeurosporenoate glycosyltransferase n=1 Tax=Cyanobacterium stanieri (strain ATCC 29140 / PCC 7202) TaxID=292563 RepID=K9YN69_CYASC|nr:glycosyl transferase family 2 [Cyanobacterium stanieri PCC 7202]
MDFQTLLNKISIIIPVFNEEDFLKQNISFFTSLENTEIIFVDGGSQDETTNILERHNLRVVLSPVACRSYQMNLGAKLARGDILLFLHGDTLLPNNYGQAIIDILSQKCVVAGAFNLKIDQHLPLINFVCMMVKVRSHLFSLPYGDQGIFMKKEIFETLGGFPEMPIMEDFALIKQLQKIGKIKIADAAVVTSARRWQKLGVVKTTLINQIIIVGYYLRIDPHRLVKIYRQLKNT